MNILIDKFVEEIEIDGIVYPIDTDFRNCLRIILAFEDNELVDEEKQIILLTNLYYDIPDNVEVALQKAVEFLDGKLMTYEKGTQSNDVRLFSFSKDASFIFSAFKQTHNIDLDQVESLHWHKFVSLFMDLGSETTFGQITSFRQRLASGRASKEEKQIARELGEIVQVERVENRTLEEEKTLEKFYRLFEEGKKMRKNVTTQ